MGKNRNQAVQLRVPLKGELLEKFRFLKRKYGLRQNTEVFRFVINQVWGQVVQEHTRAVEVSA